MAARKLAPAPVDPEQMTAVELMAKFQLETDKALESHRVETQALIVRLERRCGQLDDLVQTSRTEQAKLREAFAESSHKVSGGVREVNEALRVAVGEAKKAATAAQVYERIRDAQPNFARQVAGLQTALGKCRDQLETLRGQVNTLQGQSDTRSATLDAVKAATESNTRYLGRPGHPGTVEVS